MCFWHLVSNSLLKLASPPFKRSFDLPQGIDDLAEKGGRWEFAFQSTQRTENGVVMARLVVHIFTSLQTLSLLFPLWTQTVEGIKWQTY